MKTFILTSILCLFTFFANAQTCILKSQNCIYIDTVIVTAKIKQLNVKDIKFGIKQITEEILSEKFCISNQGVKITVEVFYFGIPKTSLRIAGIEKSNQTTQIGVKLIIPNCQTCRTHEYEGIGESDTEVRAVMIELQDGIPFQKTTVSSALKKAIQECVLKLP